MRRGAAPSFALSAHTYPLPALPPTQSGGPFATFEAEATPATNTFTLRSVGGFLALAPAREGSPTFSTAPDAPSALRWRMHPPAPASGAHGPLECFTSASAGALRSLGFLTLSAPPHCAAGLALDAARAALLRSAPAKLTFSAACEAAAARPLPLPRAPPASALPPPPAHALTPADRAFFLQHGYLHLPGAAPRLAVEAALRTINSSLGAALAAVPPLPASDAPPAPTHSAHPALLGLFASTRVAPAVAALLGARTGPPPAQCQVAPRYPAPLSPAAALQALAAAASAAHPSAPTPAAGALHATPSLLSSALPAERRAEAAPARWHVDGMDKGKAYPFSLLVGCFLSDTSEDCAGQFTVFPGSHLALAALVAEQGEGALYAAGAARPPLPPSATPLELRVRAGDAVLVHPLLAHRVGRNFSPHIRYACFFRVQAREREGVRGELLAGRLWAEFEGLQQGRAGGSAGTPVDGTLAPSTA